jgi:hypothetical protein
MIWAFLTLSAAAGEACGWLARAGEISCKDPPLGDAAGTGEAEAPVAAPPAGAAPTLVSRRALYARRRALRSSDIFPNERGEKGRAARAGQGKNTRGGDYAGSRLFLCFNFVSDLL